MAPTGHTAAHWPHCTQTTSLRLLANAGPMTVVKPRPCGKSAPTPWISLQTVTQRRQDTHLPVSRTSAGVVESIELARLLARVGDVGDVQVDGELAQLAVAAADAGLAVAVVLGEEQFEDGAPRPARARWVLVFTTMPSAGRLGARRDQRLAPLRPPPGTGGRRRWSGRPPDSRASVSWRRPAGRRPRGWCLQAPRL